MRIHYILHASFETPGAIADWAEMVGAETTFSKPFAGDTLPKVDSFDFLIVMGGPQSSLDLEDHIYLKREVELIKQAVEKDKVVLGLCLGAQLIGEALGGKAERSPHKEVGVFPIVLTEKGKLDSIFSHLPAKFNVMHWHNDMSGLPHGATVLAESAGCPRQAIRFREKVYGLQCHLEPKAEDVEQMIAHCPDDLQPSEYTQGMDALLEFDYSEMNRFMHQILNNLTGINKHSLSDLKRL